MTLATITPLSADPAGMRHRIVFSKPVLSETSPWSGPAGREQIAEVWAGFLDMAAKERSDADQRSNSEEIRFFIRYRDDLGEADRVDFDGRSFDLLTLHDPDGLKSWLIVSIRRELGDG